MTRLFLLTAALFIIFSGAIFIIRSVESRRAPSELAILFTNPDGSPCTRPCLLGMRPGITRVQEAYLITRNHPLTHNAILRQNQTNVEWALLSSPAIHLIIFKNSNGILNESSLRLQGVTLGDLINLLGQPTWVNAGISTAYLYYPSDGVIVYLVNRHHPNPFILDIFAPVEAIVIYPTTFPTFIELSEFAKPWHGFANATRYNQ